MSLPQSPSAVASRDCERCHSRKLVLALCPCSSVLLSHAYIIVHTIMSTHSYVIPTPSFSLSADLFSTPLCLSSSGRVGLDSYCVQRFENSSHFAQRLRDPSILSRVSIARSFFPLHSVSLPVWNAASLVSCPPLDISVVFSLGL